MTLNPESWFSAGEEGSLRPYLLGSVAGHVLLTLVAAWFGHLMLEPPPSLQLLKVDLTTMEAPREKVVEQPKPEPIVEDPIEPSVEEVAEKPIPAPPEDVQRPVLPTEVEAADPTIEPEPNLVEDIAAPDTEIPREPQPIPETISEDDVDFLEPEEVVTRPQTQPEPVEEAVEEFSAEAQEVAAGAVVQAKASQGIDDAYLTLVQTKIGRSWRPTAASTRGQSGVQTTVRFRIGPAGQVIAPTVLVSSGLSVFDRQALVAVERSTPLPTPPARFGDEGIEIDFLFSFKL